MSVTRIGHALDEMVRLNSASATMMDGAVSQMAATTDALSTIQASLMLLPGGFADIVTALASVAAMINVVASTQADSSKTALTAALGSQTSTTLANITGLSLPVVAGQTYELTGLIVFQTSSALTGIKLGFTFPAGAMTATAIIPNGLTSALTGFITTSATPLTATTVGASGTNYLVLIKGIYQPTASGTLQAQAANGTIVGNITIGAGSGLVLRKLL